MEGRGSVGAVGVAWGASLGLHGTRCRVSIAKKCFDIWSILKMASVKSVGAREQLFQRNSQ